MATFGSPLSLEVTSFEVVNYLDLGSRALCSTSSTMAASDVLGVTSMIPMLIRLMMTPCTMVSSITLVDASGRRKHFLSQHQQQLLLLLL